MSETYPAPLACAYESPRTVAEAVALLAHHGRDARVLAGGTDLTIAMRDKGVRPTCLVDIKRIPELHDLRWLPDGGLEVGAAVSMVRLLWEDRLQAASPMLCQAMETVGSYQLRTRATLAGNICNASPAADTVPPMLAMGAEVVVAGPAGKQTVPLEQFFTGPGRHVLQPGDLVVAVRFPAWGLTGRGVYLKQGRRQAMEIAIVGVAALQPVGQPVRLAIASVAPRPLRLVQAEAALAAGKGIEAAVQAAQAQVSPISDARSSAEYRRHLVGVLVRRALRSVMGGDGV